MNKSKNKPKYNLDRPLILHIPKKHCPNTGLSFRAEGQGFFPGYCKSAPAASIKRKYSRTPVTPTLKGNEKQFEFSGSIAKFTLPC